jgi:hypothetical protein
MRSEPGDLDITPWADRVPQIDARTTFSFAIAVAIKPGTFFTVWLMGSAHPN